MPPASEALALSTESRPRTEALTVPLSRDRAREVEISQSSCTIFPFELRCCPCLPSSWTKVQDWLHLVLITGVLASLACVIQMISELAWGGCYHSPLCYKQIISGVCVLPSTVYFIRTIGTYDEQLRQKKERHREEVENLIEVINKQVEQMNNLCRKIAGNANDFAGGRFNDKSENFSRFLKSVKLHYKDLYASEDMLKELRHFVLSWLRVFSGSILNRQESPLLKGAEVQLQRCQTAEEVCDEVIRRIEHNRVNFGLSRAEAPMLRSGQSPGDPGGSFHSASSQATDLESAHSNSNARCGVKWLEFGRCRGCSCRQSPTRDGMPVRMEAGCFSLRVLSRQHANLLFAFGMDILLLVFEACSMRWPSFVLVAVNETCIVSMLACFEQINEIAQLERQIAVFEQRKERVEQQTAEVESDWEKVQQLHDLWLYRTLPSLAILGKVHNHLADRDMEVSEDVRSGGGQLQDPRPEFLSLANQSFAALDQKLGPLEDWCGSERLDERWKQSIGQQLKACEGDTDVMALVQRLPILTSDLSLLEDRPPPGSQDLALRVSPQPSPMGSPRSSRSAASSFVSMAGSAAAAPPPTAPPPAAGASGGWFRRRG